MTDGEEETGNDGTGANRCDAVGDNSCDGDEGWWLG